MHDARAAARRFYAAVVATAVTTTTITAGSSGHIYSNSNPVSKATRQLTQFAFWKNSRRGDEHSDDGQKERYQQQRSIRSFIPSSDRTSKQATMRKLVGQSVIE